MVLSGVLLYDELMRFSIPLLHITSVYVYALRKDICTYGALKLS